MQIRVKTYDETREERVTIEVPAGQKFSIELGSDTVGETDRTADVRIRSNAEMRRDLAAATRRIAELEAERKTLWTSNQVGDFQVSEAELIAAPLRRDLAEAKARISELEHDISVRSDIGIKAALRRDEEIDRLKAELKTEQTEREKNREWAERAELRMAQLYEELEQVREQAEKDQAVLIRQVSEYDLDRKTEQARADRLQGELTKVSARLEVCRDQRLKISRTVNKVADLVASEDITQSLSVQFASPEANDLQQAVREIRKTIRKA